MITFKNLVWPKAFTVLKLFFLPFFKPLFSLEKIVTLYVQLDWLLETITSCISLNVSCIFPDPQKAKITYKACELGLDYERGPQIFSWEGNFLHI